MFTHPVAGRRCRALPVALASVLVAIAAPARAQTTIPPDFALTVVGGDLDQPVNFDVLPDGRVLVAEQHSGRIRLVDPGVEQTPPIVGTVDDLRDGVFDGLLGIAVDPRWPAFPYVYTYSVSASTPNLRLLRHTLTGDLEGTGARHLAIDPYLERPILTDLPSDGDIHRGGTIEFGPDGMLYVAVGDDSWSCSAQDLDELRGKILRLTVASVPAGPGPAPTYASLAPFTNPFFSDPNPRTRLVYHYGLRNPWVFDFDRGTNELVVADVGFDDWEEIDRSLLPGRNFGWPLLEGPEPYLNCSEVEPGPLTGPVFAYPHDSTAAAVTIGLAGVAREGTSVEGFPEGYWGQVFYYDFFVGELRRLACAGGTCGPAPSAPGQPASDAWGSGFAGVTRMRFLADGALWYLHGSQLRRIHYVGPVTGVPGPLAAAEVRMAAFPSPGRGPVTIELVLPAGVAAPSALVIRDVAGRRVRTLARPAGAAGEVVRWTWDGRTDRGDDAGSGVFFATIDAGGARVARRIVRLRAGIGG